MKATDRVQVTNPENHFYGQRGTVTNVYQPSNYPVRATLENGTIADFDEDDLTVYGMTITKANFNEVAKWIGPDVRISQPWTKPHLHFETGFAEPGFKTTATVGDRIEKTEDGKFQIWVDENNVASDESPAKISGYALAEAAAGMKRFGDMLREDRPEMLMPENFGPIHVARVMVHKMHYGPSSETPLDLEEVYVVWFCKTLQNWKAMVSSNAKDNAYYEVTHNGDKNETYVDRYVKETNTVYHHETGISDVTPVNNFGRIW